MNDAVKLADDIRSILSKRPTESLDLELKNWLDIASPHGISKIAKACLALRNNDGGRLVIGFDDNGISCKHANPQDISKIYSSDAVQQIVGKYASEPFGIKIEYVDIDGVDYPVVTVPSGVTSPVICKADLRDNEKLLLRDNALYVRTISSNHRVSSSEVCKGDWVRLFSICFENREADIARFVRRHLLDVLDPKMLQATASHGRGVSTLKLLDEGYGKYRDICISKSPVLPDNIGYREFSVEISGTSGEITPTSSVLQNIASNMPRISGWSPWVILSGSQKASDHPVFTQQGFESFIDYSSGGFLGPHIDYWLIWTCGKYYHIRGLEDDFVSYHAGYESITPGKHLDFLLQISRVAEGIAVALSISETLGFDMESLAMKFSVRWQGLKGRVLSSWADHRRLFRSHSEAHQDIFVDTVTVPLNTPKSEIHIFVASIIHKLFALFGGEEIHGSVVENICNDCLNRRL